MVSIDKINKMRQYSRAPLKWSQVLQKEYADRCPLLPTEFKVASRCLDWWNPECDSHHDDQKADTAWKDYNAGVGPRPPAAESLSFVP